MINNRLMPWNAADMGRLVELADRGRELMRQHQPQARAGEWFRVANADDPVAAELFIFGVIGDDWDPDDVTAGGFTRELRAITAPTIDLHINSPGGLVFDGIAIHSALKDHPATVNVHIDGLAASAASFVAMAGDTVAIQKPAKMMIHDASGLTIGNAADMLEMAELLDDLSDTIAGIYADRAGGEVAEWRDRMRATTWYGSADAVAAGLADQVTNDSSAPDTADTTNTSTPGPARRGLPVNAAPAAETKHTGKDHTVNTEQIMAAMRELVAAADGRTMTDEEVRAYDALAQDLAQARTDQVRARQAELEAPSPTNISASRVASPRKRETDDSIDAAFNHFLRTGRPNNDLSDLRVTNAQTVGTDTEGGYTVPEGFRQKLVERMKAFGGLAEEAETVTTSTGAPLPWPTLDDTSNEGEIAAESAAGAGGADLVFGEKSLGAYKYVAPGESAQPLRVSVELLQDAAFDIEGLITRKLGQRIARVQASDWVTGTGTNEPEGITSKAANLTFATGSTTTVDKDQIIDVFHALDPEYRMTAKWLISDSTLAAVRKLEDSTGRPLWQENAASGLEQTPGGFLLGRPVVIDQAMPAMAASAKSWIFGDLQQSYAIRRVRDITLVVNPWTRAANGEVEYTCWARADGAVQNDWSYVIGANSAT